MEKLNAISLKYRDLPYMQHEKALYFRNLILSNSLKEICELGFLHGKSSVYIGSILEEQGFGHLTTFDFEKTIPINPNIDDLITEFNLQKYVSPIKSKEGYVWELYELIQSKNFDLCFIDGDHTFESTSITFLMIDKLMIPGGYVIFDDYTWTVERFKKNNNLSYLKNVNYDSLSEKQKKLPGVKMACEIFIDNNNYELVDIKEQFDIIVYKKKERK